MDFLTPEEVVQELEELASHQNLSPEEAEEAMSAMPARVFHLIMSMKHHGLLAGKHLPAITKDGIAETEAEKEIIHTGLSTIGGRIQLSDTPKIQPTVPRHLQYDSDKVQDETEYLRQYLMQARQAAPARDSLLKI